MSSKSSPPSATTTTGDQAYTEYDYYTLDAYVSGQGTVNEKLATSNKRLTKGEASAKIKKAKGRKQQYLENWQQTWDQASTRGH